MPKSTTYRPPKGGQKPVKPTRDPKAGIAAPEPKASVKVGLPTPQPAPKIDKVTGGG